jgi:hypothetical protein
LSKTFLLRLLELDPRPTALFIDNLALQVLLKRIRPRRPRRNY